MFFCKHQWTEKIFTLEELGFPNLTTAIRNGREYTVNNTTSSEFKSGWVGYPQKETFVVFTKCKKCHNFDIRITDGLYRYTFDGLYIKLKIIKYLEGKINESNCSSN